MKLEKKLPKEAIRQLGECGGKEEDVMYFVMTDMALEGHFTNGYLVLTKEEVYLLSASANPNEEKENVYRFGGYTSDLPEEQIVRFEVQKWKFDDIEELSILRQVNGGILYGKSSGSEFVIAGFSNSRMSEFDRLTQIFGKMKSGEELKKEDFESEHKHEYCPKCGTMFPNQERKVCPKCMDKKSIFMRVLGYFKPHKVKIAIMIVCYVITAVLNLVWPYLNGTILYDKVLKKDEAFLAFTKLPAGKFAVLLGMVVLTMLLCKVTNQILGIIQGVLVSKIVPDVVKNMKNDVFHSMGKLSISFYNSRQTGGLMTRVLHDANEVTGFFIDGLPYFLINILTIILSCVVMFSLHAGLAAISLILLPVLTMVSYFMLPRLWSFYGKRHRANRSLNGQINDNLTGARVVKAFGQEDKEIVRFGKYNKRVRDAEMSLVGYDNRFYALYAIVENISLFLVWGVGSMLVLGKTHMELGILITFTGYVSQLNGPLDFLSYCFRWWTNSVNSAQRIFEIIDAVPEIKEKVDPIRPSKIRGEIELKNVTFGYEQNKPVLKDISFHVEEGQMLGIVGRSGAGKSTLVNLISRLYDPQEGNIFIDGINVKDMGFHEIRKSIAMVSQETYIFMGTVADNIAYARPEATKEEIIAAAVQASAHNFICKMPDGYDTMIGSSGRSLSGGERQRVSIARAILANPRILILDEATAAVDTETEQAIQHSLERLIKGRTTLSIAHRLSTLNKADKLIVVDDGKLTEAGTHQELIDKKGTYYRLMQLQTKALAMRGLE